MAAGIWVLHLEGRRHRFVFYFPVGSVEGGPCGAACGGVLAAEGCGDCLRLRSGCVIAEEVAGGEGLRGEVGAV